MTQTEFDVLTQEAAMELLCFWQAYRIFLFILQEGNAR